MSFEFKNFDVSELIEALKSRAALIAQIAHLESEVQSLRAENQQLIAWLNIYKDKLNSLMALLGGSDTSTNQFSTTAPLLDGAAIAPPAPTEVPAAAPAIAPPAPTEVSAAAPAIAPPVPPNLGGKS